MLKEIVLPNGATFQISPTYRVYFNGQPIVKLSPEINLEKFAMLMMTDKKLNELTTKYLRFLEIRNQLDEEIETLRAEISDMIDEAKTLTYAELSQPLGCVDVKKNVEKNYVEYTYKNFSLKVEIRNYDFSCLTKAVGEELYSLCPNLNVRIAQSDKNITIFVNSQMVYVTTEFPIRKVLSFLKESAINGELTEFVEVLKNLYLLYMKSLEGGNLFVEIIHRVEELAKEVS